MRILNLGEDEQPHVEINADKEPKTLGLLWDANKDNLRYSVTIFKDKRITKRSILSDIAKIFDPLGLIAPAILQAKLSMQKLWQLQLAWDESLPQDIHSQWTTYRTDLDHINSIVVPRHASLPDCQSTQIHGFCDASERAYGACVYLRTVGTQGTCKVQLLCAKSRVAPLKRISLPRLELCGALLLSQLISKVRSALSHDYQEFYWTDSTIVIAWLKASPSRWKTFVANRTTEIQRLTSDTWNHVTSEQNPADIISRGLRPSELANAGLWWNGPEWLAQSPDCWPAMEVTTQDPPEERTISRCLVSTQTSEWDIFTRFSSYSRLIRVTAYCSRWLRRHRENRMTRDNSAPMVSVSTCLSVREIADARTVLLKIAQLSHFSSEILFCAVAQCRTPT
ncbi:uncharacterized protein LOC122400518 [Colletes gigas]|uniref:uncharacterized protein LOC122400518 n=1 Tax=Colletes gigas TaxID=935657 RepID=UPI001C9B580F|nr:uncharacterized protein LOC122400518 [Colletes gigas]